LKAQIPALIISGDRSATALRAIEASGCMFIAKPVKATDLLAVVDALVKLAKPGWLASKKPRTAAISPSPATPESNVAVIDDEPGTRDAIRMILESEGHRVATYASAEAFLADSGRNRFRCLLVDIALPGIDGLALQKRLKSEQLAAPIIFVTAHSEMPLAVQAMREGAADFLQKPVHGEELRMSVARSLGERRDQGDDRGAEQESVAARLATLSERERQVMEGVLAGQATKHIAADLGISQRTAEHHRQSVMQKMGAKSLASLVRMILPHLGQPQPPAIPPASKQEA
jgi:two-component system CheB/CheR fusion protein